MVAGTLLLVLVAGFVPTALAEHEPPRPSNGKPSGETPGAGTRFI